ncbi:MAG: hypothetical protein EZS28_017303 [Streblomastix strix]|uniref:Uncharacterized protein n=1 Tax=Streblomastix strix TaxID=222440 RepID=A0A5J4VXU9_9EUKA|nr:MAG: hypothetical protein EZS28_017303 [Streblomastix strix]
MGNYKKDGDHMIDSEDVDIYREPIINEYPKINRRSRLPLATNMEGLAGETWLVLQEENWQQMKDDGGIARIMGFFPHYGFDIHWWEQNFETDEFEVSLSFVSWAHQIRWWMNDSVLTILPSKIGDVRMGPNGGFMMRKGEGVHVAFDMESLGYTIFIGISLKLHPYYAFWWVITHFGQVCQCMSGSGVLARHFLEFGHPIFELKRQFLEIFQWEADRPNFVRSGLADLAWPILIRI